MVREFPNMFPYEIMGILPPYDIDFKIDLLQVIEPVSKVPCHLRLTRIVELCTILEDLLEKGYI